MFKSAVKIYTNIIVFLSLTGCTALMESFAPIDESDSAPVSTPQTGGFRSPQMGNSQMFQQQTMQQRRMAVNGNMGTGGTGGTGGAGGAGGAGGMGGGPDETRMQQMRERASGGGGVGQGTASTLVPGGIIGPRTPDQQKQVAKDPTPGGPGGANTPQMFNEKLVPGKQLYEQKNFAQAALEFEKFLKENEESDDIPETLYYLGNCYFELQDWTKAATAFRKVDQLYHLYPLAPQASLKLAQCYENMGQPRMADSVRKDMQYKYTPGSYELPPPAAKPAP